MLESRTLQQVLAETGPEPDWEYRKGWIAVHNSSTGEMQCLNCNAVWWSNLRSGGYYCRGSWTCHNCGANSKGAFSESH
jgi:hypothetical protein